MSSRPPKQAPKRAALALDDWKLPTFKKHLDAAGYQYDEPIVFIPGSLVLRVYFHWVHELKPIVEAAEAECQLSKLTANDGEAKP
jgi:hypothetical protein